MNNTSTLSSRSCLYAAAAAAILGLSLQPAAAQDIISFNAVGGTAGGMIPADFAGAPGVSAYNWNNMYSLVTSVTSPMTRVDGFLDEILDDTGAAVEGLKLSWDGVGLARAAGGGTNDQRMFESEWDLFDSGNDINAVDMTFQLTGVPFAKYDVYFYVQDADNAEIRGGDITANGIMESIKMFNFTADIPGGAFSYVEANNGFSYDGETSAMGTYVRIEGVSGSTLDLTVSSKNPGVPRLRMSGFQIVAVPEPSTAAALLGGVGLLLGRRRSRRA